MGRQISQVYRVALIDSPTTKRKINNPFLKLAKWNRDQSNMICDKGDIPL